MHEYSLASQVWASVAAAAQKHGGRRVRSVTLEIGALNLIEESQIRFWLSMLAARAGSPDLTVKITSVPARVTCAACGAEGEPGLPDGEADHYLPVPLRCGKCGSRDVRVVGGRELRVVSAEIETEVGDGDNAEAGAPGVPLDRA